MPIELHPETTKRLVATIKPDFFEDRSEEIGDLQATLPLDICVMEIGPVIHNKGTLDAQAHMTLVVEDLDSVVFLTELR